jgi:hypothetical protein
MTARSQTDCALKRDNKLNLHDFLKNQRNGKMVVPTGARMPPKPTTDKAKDLPPKHQGK